MKAFCRSVVSSFEEEFLRDPLEKKLVMAYMHFACVGFPGCIGCLEEQWGNCSIGLQRNYVWQGGVLILRLKGVVDHIPRLCHLAFELPSVLHDLNNPFVSDYFGRLLSRDFPLLL